MIASSRTAPRVGWWVLGAGGLLAVFLLRSFQPGQAEFYLCVFRNLTGVPCPGCGLTRAFAALASADFSAATRLHPLAPLLAVETVVLWLAWGVHRGRPLMSFLRANGTALAVGNSAPFVALWLGRAATGTLPW